MPPGPVVILTALGIEAKAIARAIGMRRESLGVFRTPSDANPTVLHVIGPRGMCLPPPDRLHGASAIIVAGFTGGLDPALSVGDVVLDPWPASLTTRLACVPGRIHTTQTIIIDRAEKARLFACTGARVVDMEHDVVRAALKQSVPLYGVRAVIDTANESLPPSLERMVDPRGRSRALATVMQVVYRPATLHSLLVFAQRSCRVGRSLGAAVGEVISAIQRG